MISTKKLDPPQKMAGQLHARWQKNMKGQAKGLRLQIPF